MIDVSVLRAGPQTTQHGLEQRNVLAAEELHFLLEGLAHGYAHGQAELRTTSQVRLAASHLRIAARLVRTVAGAPVLRRSHAASLATAGGGASASGIAAIGRGTVAGVVVAEEANKIVLGMLVLEGGAQIARDSALQAAIAGELVQMRRTGIEGPIVQAELAHGLRLVGEHAAEAAARGILIRPLIPAGIGAASATPTPAGAGRVARVGGVAIRGGEARPAVRNGQRLLIRRRGHIQRRRQTHVPADADAERHGEGVHGQPVHGAVLAANRTARRQAVHRERGIGRVAARAAGARPRARTAIALRRQVHLGAEYARRLRQPVHLERGAAEGHGQRAEDHLANGRNIRARRTIVLRKKRVEINKRSCIWATDWDWEAAAHLVAIFRTHFDQVAAVVVGMCLGMNLAILQRRILVILEELAARAAAAVGFLQRHLLQGMRVEEQTPAVTVVLSIEQDAHLARIEGELAAKQIETERERDSEMEKQRDDDVFWRPRIESQAKPSHVRMG